MESRAGGAHPQAASASWREVGMSSWIKEGNARRQGRPKLPRASLPPVQMSLREQDLGDVLQQGNIPDASVQRD
jgi:hypothetical protein